MSLWTRIRDIGEGVATGGFAGGFNKGIGDWEGGLFNKLTGRMNDQQKRIQQQLIDQQTQAYKNQTDLADQQYQNTLAQEKVERSRINEKQIRALRNNYRPQGFLNNQNNAGIGATQLGASPGVISKLGNA